MANVWFISDLHAGHKNIHKFRTGFESEESHYETIKRNYHKVVTKRDKVFFLGDVAFNKERLADISTWVGEQKVLICGNHDLENGIKMQDLCNTYTDVYSLLRYKELWLSHAPIHPNELRGKYNLHGHVHYSSVDDPRYFNCCLENTNYAPISLAEIRTRLGIVNGVKENTNAK
jgi:calcineurin-like phosphoesterase family protein